MIEQAANADTIVDEATAAGLDGPKIVVSTKMLRAELLSVKAYSSANWRRSFWIASSAGSAFTTSVVSA